MTRISADVDGVPVIACGKLEDPANAEQLLAGGAATNTEMTDAIVTVLGATA